MTEERHLSPLLAPKRAFRDAYERRAYGRAYLLGKRLLEEPSLVERGRDFLHRFVKKDPRQKRIFVMWDEVLGLPVDQLVSQLLADNPRGAELRATAPVFVVIAADEIRAVARSAVL